MFSLSPTEANAKIAGLCAINGKYSNKYEGIESVYNNNVSESYLPYADIMTVVENDAEDTLIQQRQLFDDFFKKYYNLL